MIKSVVVVVLLIVAAAGSAATAVQAQSGGGIEVRITAQRLEDGRTEFAIEQREGDGGRGRLAPRARFLPAEPPVDRWLVSTPVTIAAPVEPGQSGNEVEVRITARRLEDGRTEFAVEQREGDGWSERIAPRARFLPAEPPVGRWLFSTPVTVGGSTLASPVDTDARLAEDQATLLSIRNALTGTAALNWSEDVPLAEWEGVTVGGAPLRVTGLALPDKSLSGVIPPGLGNLPGLEVLSLSGALLSGPIPPELGSLPNLTSLSLSGNRITGAIPPSWAT